MSRGGGQTFFCALKGLEKREPRPQNPISIADAPRALQQETENESMKEESREQERASGWLRLGAWDCSGETGGGRRR